MLSRSAAQPSYTDRVKPWLLYSLARLGIFAGALVILLLLGLPWYFAAIVAALIGLLISYIALPKLRHEVTASLAARRDVREHDADTDFEDAQLDLDAAAHPHEEPVSDAQRHAARRTPANASDAAVAADGESGLEREGDAERDGVEQRGDR